MIHVGDVYRDRWCHGIYIVMSGPHEGGSWIARRENDDGREGYDMLMDASFLERFDKWESVVENELKIGSIVKLKSGGPSMTVNGNAVDGKISCLWFATSNTGNFSPFFHDFSRDALEDCTVVVVVVEDDEE